MLLPAIVCTAGMAGHLLRTHPTTACCRNEIVHTLIHLFRKRLGTDTALLLLVLHTPGTLSLPLESIPQRRLSAHSPAGLGQGSQFPPAPGKKGSNHSSVGLPTASVLQSFTVLQLASCSLS